MFTHERQETEFESGVVRPSWVSHLGNVLAFFRGEYPPVVLPRNIKRLVDQMSTRSEHRFAGQRTSLESPLIALEHAQDSFDYFLGEAHASPIEAGSNLTKIDDGLGFDDGLRFDDGLSFDEFVRRRFAPRMERVT